MYTQNDHTFAICAYKESPFLEDCILSLKNQTVQSRLLLSTATPNDHIRALAEKYDIPLIINTGIKGIGGDWNCAYDHTDTPLVTIAHQDDIYEPGYTQAMLDYVNRSKDPILYFSGYGELRGETKVYDNKILKIKKLMLLPLQPGMFWHSRFMRRMVLSMGCPICCPAVTMVKDCFGSTPFLHDYKAALDWQQWELQSRKNGSFVYNPEPLMCHRIHEGSATTEIIGDNKRSDEEYEMYRKFWIAPIAKLLTRLYSGSQSSNQL